MLIKKTLNLNEGDWEKMSEMFPKEGPSIAIRNLVTLFCTMHYKEGRPARLKGMDIEL